MITPFLSILLLNLFPLKIWLAWTAKGKLRVCNNLNAILRRGPLPPATRRMNNLDSERMNLNNVDLAQTTKILGSLSLQESPHVARRKELKKEGVLGMISSERGNHTKSKKPVNASLEPQHNVIYNDKLAEDTTFGTFWNKLYHNPTSLITFLKGPATSKRSIDFMKSSPLQHTLGSPPVMPSPSKNVDLPWATRDGIHSLTKNEGKNDKTNGKSTSDSKDGEISHPPRGTEAILHHQVFNLPKYNGSMRERLLWSRKPVSFANKGRSVATLASTNDLDEEEKRTIEASSGFYDMAMNAKSGNAVEDIFNFRRDVARLATQTQEDMTVYAIHNSGDKAEVSTLVSSGNHKNSPVLSGKINVLQEADTINDLTDQSSYKTFRKDVVGTRPQFQEMNIRTILNNLDDDMKSTMSNSKEAPTMSVMDTLNGLTTQSSPLFENCNAANSSDIKAPQLDQETIVKAVRKALIQLAMEATLGAKPSVEPLPGPSIADVTSHLNLFLPSTALEPNRRVGNVTQALAGPTASNFSDYIAPGYHKLHQETEAELPANGLENAAYAYELACQELD